jgi:hypothetical protein
MIGSRVLPDWTGWLAVAAGAVMLGLFVFTRNVRLSCSTWHPWRSV